MLSKKTNWKNEVTEQKIVDAIECMALRISWRFRLAGKIMFHGDGSSWYVIPSFFFLPSFVLK